MAEKPMKVYSGITHVSGEVRDAVYPNASWKGQVRAVVAARSGAEARRRLAAHGLRITATEWTHGWGETGNPADGAIATSALGRVFVRDLDRHGLDAPAFLLADGREEQRPMLDPAAVADDPARHPAIRERLGRLADELDWLLSLGVDPEYRRLTVDADEIILLRDEIREHLR